MDREAGVYEGQAIAYRQAHNDLADRVARQLERVEQLALPFAGVANSPYVTGQEPAKTKKEATRTAAGPDARDRRPPARGGGSG